MVNKINFKYPSRDGIHNCQAYKWQSTNIPVRGIVQIVHGMQEHMSRYDGFAEFLCNNGFLVVGNDHLGHGCTVSDESEFGYFAKDYADIIVVRDVHRLKKMTESENPGLPYFILGHSMGSFIARKYITMYKKGISGVILCGTGYKPGIVTATAIFLSKILGAFSKGHNESRFLEKISFGSYNNRITNPSDSREWLVRNENVLTNYNNDSLCGFKFTVNGYKTLFSLLHFVDKEKNLTDIPKELPIFIISGMEDPVGDYGKGPKNVYDTYKKIGIKDVSIKLYEDIRHEILNDMECERVYKDILNWIEEHIK